MGVTAAAAATAVVVVVAVSWPFLTTWERCGSELQRGTATCWEALSVIVVVVVVVVVVVITVVVIVVFAVVGKFLSVFTLSDPIPTSLQIPEGVSQDCSRPHPPGGSACPFLRPLIPIAC